MNYRSLLVYLDNTPGCEARTQVAIRLARERDCHLAGLAPTGLIDLPPAPDAAPPVAEYTAQAQEELRNQAQQAAQRFAEACRTAGVKSFETVVDEGAQATSVVSHAHCSDITVISQAGPASPLARLTQSVVEQVVLYSARPTLVVPHTGHFTQVGQRVLVAWDDSREAARAVADALPLLCRAKSVMVVQWNEPGNAVSRTQRERLESFQRWLMWHGVNAEVQTETTQMHIAQALESRALSMQADLIVMGAYGHSRWAERVLGGATRGLLQSMKVPVLMSH